ncbi:MAG: aldehyde dehydrogenase family protein, partial [Firmicutes bacterium]|nr:aldehyde dehydrogenase family protein [Bacillota bacterium]
APAIVCKDADLERAAQWIVDSRIGNNGQICNNAERVYVQKEVKEALEFHVEGMIEDGDDVPQWLADGEYEFKWVMMDTASLIQSLEGMTTIAAISRATGINERLLSHYANGIKRPSVKQRQKIVDGIHLIGKTLMKI